MPVWPIDFVCNHLLLGFYFSSLLFSIPEIVLGREVWFKVYECESMAFSNSNDNSDFWILAFPKLSALQMFSHFLVTKPCGLRIRRWVASQSPGNLLEMQVFLFVCFCFWGLHPRRMEVPRLGVKSELHLPATATAMWDPSHVRNLYHSLQQPWIPDPLSNARDWNCILMNSSQISFHCSTTGTPRNIHFNKYIYKKYSF